MMTAGGERVAAVREGTAGIVTEMGGMRITADVNDIVAGVQASIETIDDATEAGIAMNATHIDETTDGLIEGMIVEGATEH